MADVCRDEVSALARHREEDYDVGSTFIQMRAIVVCFHATLGIRDVDMEGIQMSTYLLDGVEALIDDHQMSVSGIVGELEG